MGLILHTSHSSPYLQQTQQDEDSPTEILYRKIKPPLPSILKISSACFGEGPLLFHNPAYECALTLNYNNVVAAHWKIFVSINPPQFNTAWPIIQDCLYKTNLKISGTVQREDALPSQQIDFTICRDQQDSRIWKSFLENITQNLYREGVSCDPRPINSDPEQRIKERCSIIPSNKDVPPYISYKSTAYMVSFCSSQKIKSLYVESIKIIFAEEYADLSEEDKHNPTHAIDFLRDIRLF